MILTTYKNLIINYVMSSFFNLINPDKSVTLLVPHQWIFWHESIVTTKEFTTRISFCVTSTHSTGVFVTLTHRTRLPVRKSGTPLPFVTTQCTRALLTMLCTVVWKIDFPLHVYFPIPCVNLPKTRGSRTMPPHLVIITTVSTII